MLPNRHPWHDLRAFPLPLARPERGDEGAPRPSRTQGWAAVPHFWGLCPQEGGLGTASALSLADLAVPPAWLSLCAKTPALAGEEELGQGKRPWRIPAHQLIPGCFGRALELSANAQSPALSGSFLPLLLFLSLLKDGRRGALRSHIFGGQEGDGDLEEAAVPFPEHFPETAASSALSNLFTPRGGPKAQLTVRKEISTPSGPTQVPPKSRGRCFSVCSFCLVPCPASTERCSAPGGAGTPRTWLLGGDDVGSSSTTHLLTNPSSLWGAQHRPHAPFPPPRPFPP